MDLAKSYWFDVMILNFRLPDMKASVVVRRLRSAKVRTPVLVLLDANEIDEELHGLAMPDDYLTKPFHKSELIARIHAIVRRSKGHSESVIKTGKLVVNLDTRSVDVDGRRLHVTGKEYSILELLSLRKGTTLTKEMFLDHLYGGIDEPELKIIDVFICKLRKKIAAATGGQHYIDCPGAAKFLGYFHVHLIEPLELALSACIAYRGAHAIECHTHVGLHRDMANSRRE